MRVAVFSTKPYDRRALSEAFRGSRHELVFLEPRLTASTVPLAASCDAACLFVNDDGGVDTLRLLAAAGIRLVTLRSTGYNNVDLAAARDLAITVARVPSYSPYAVAEHAAALVLSLNRKIHRAYARVREGNFALEGLLGFDLHGRSVGVIGTGRTGIAFARIMVGFGCEVIAYDPRPDPAAEAAGVQYVEWATLLERSDIVSLHCPLTPATTHLVGVQAISTMRRGVMLVNTSRGGIVDTGAAIEGLKSGQIGSLALDVYEGEAGLFFEDLSDEILRDDMLARLLTFPNVLVTAHQAFFTREALEQIAATTLQNVEAFARTGVPLHPIRYEPAQ